MPRVDHDLDTQNFERFDEDMNMSPGSGGQKKWTKTDPNFIGYTYKNWEAVHPDSTGGTQQGSAQVQLKKKAAARPTLQQVQSNLQAMGLSSHEQQQ